jgi:hypothetical protein
MIPPATGALCLSTSEETPLSVEIDSKPMAAEAGAPAVGGEPEPCTTCGAPMAADQRYCLECGTRRAHLGGVLHGLRGLAATSATTAVAGSGYGPGAGAGAGVGAVGVGGGLGEVGGGMGAAVPGAPPGVAGTHPGQPTMAVASAQAPRGSGATAVIAGVGVLLLAMGVGVLIGRAGSSGSKAAAPQVISVASPGASTAGTASTPASTPTTAAKPAHSSASSPSSSSTLSKKAVSEGVGQVPTKPAPPSVLKSLHGGSGQSYEQKSKSLPNVVSTG